MLGLKEARGAFIGLVLIPFASLAALAQQSHVLLNDQKVVATEIEVSSAEPYTLPEGRNGAIWVALTPVTLFKVKDGKQNSWNVQAGDAEMSGSNEVVQFRAGGGSPARLVVIHPRAPHQELTVEPFVMRDSIEDASERNQTLFVAITDCHFQDTRNLGDESRWTPSKPETVRMKAGSVKWIQPGIHHFKNIRQAPAKLVSIEW